MHQLGRLARARRGIPAGNSCHRSRIAFRRQHQQQHRLVADLLELLDALLQFGGGRLSLLLRAGERCQIGSPVFCSGSDLISSVRSSAKGRSARSPVRAGLRLRTAWDARSDPSKYRDRHDSYGYYTHVCLHGYWFTCSRTGGHEFRSFALGGCGGSINSRKVWPHEISEIGQPDARVASLEQWAAKFIFQLSDRNCDRRLFNPAAFSSLRKTFFFAKRDKIADLIHFHDAGPPLSSSKFYCV